MNPPNISPTMSPHLKKTIPPTMLEIWARIASTLASFMFIWTMFRQFIPYELRSSLEKHIANFCSYFHSYLKVTIPEYSSKSLRRSQAYTNIETYLSSLPSKTVKRFMGEIELDGKKVTLTMDDYERLEDEFRGAKIWWISGKLISSNPTRSNGNTSQSFQNQEMKFSKLTFHQKYKDLVTGEYLQHVVKQGKETRVKNRQRRLYTNAARPFRITLWSCIPFEHPATFDNIAMDPKKKQEIMDDLVKFSESKDFYARIGKPWKRGYLLYGPPGTGKSTMIAAMANLLQYDVFDIELTAVKDNNELRRLLMETTNKSIIVIEDIDCSLNLTSQRKKQNKNEQEVDEMGNVGSKVTLSGLLNAIDGIWSSCVGERVVVFTTNHVEKLDPALIRRGRMDKHIEMSYCGFEGFKVLAKNYLFVEEHEMFGEISKLLSEVEITPADVAENLMPKSCEEGANECLKKLIMALEDAKEVAAKKNRVDEEQEVGTEELKRKDDEIWGHC